MQRFDWSDAKQKIGSVAVLVLLSMAARPAFAGATFPTAVDTAFGMPIPPRHAPFGVQASLYASIVFAAIGLIVLMVAIHDARRTKTALPVFVALSGAFCAIPEIFIDIAGGCFWPYAEGHVVYTFLGRPMTWYPIFAWFGFGAVLAYVPYALFLRRAKISWLWIGLAITCAFDILVEEIMLNVPGLYVYYGQQPLILFTKFPAWWMFTNIPGVFFASALAWRFKDDLKGWRGLLMFALTPTAFLAVFGFAVMPASIVILGNYSWLTTQIGGLLTSILGLTASALIIRIVLNRDPLALSERVG
ncbi:hypothetical protein [Bosea vaviloviae]|uniref:Carotenoid biosynthesis protein n=1 Tax=Bosea vaviloviae TaxID=1526658 RepID=A0A0N1FJ17_9HYPH|nr:hypothetical protein [Bosea vaviloviae]KPH81411.1 hypothetical protein AE618_08760 [Bosea vaviloviae]